MPMCLIAHIRGSIHLCEDITVPVYIKVEHNVNYVVALEYMVYQNYYFFN
jgi:hypothetical protein